MSSPSYPSPDAAQAQLVVCVLPTSADQQRTAWFDGRQFGGDTEVCAEANHAAANGEHVQLFGLFPTPAATSTDLGALAALMAYRPGRTTVSTCHQQLSEHLDELFQGAGCGSGPPSATPA